MALGIIVVGGKFASGEQWDEAPVAGVERDVVMIMTGFPTWKAGHNHAVYLHAPCTPAAHHPHNRVQWRVVAAIKEHHKP